MGYCIELNDVDIKIKKENQNKVVKAIKDFVVDWESKHDHREHLMWIDHSTLKNARHIFDVFDELRYNLELDVNEDYVVTEFLGEKLGEELDLFNAIAPYVEPKSYIIFEGEDDCVFGYFFDGEKCTEKSLRKRYKYDPREFE